MSERAEIDQNDIVQWLVRYVADITRLDPSQVNPTLPFLDYGLDSTAAIGLTGDVGRWLGLEVSPSAPFDYPTIEILGVFLEARLRAGKRRALPEHTP